MCQSQVLLAVAMQRLAPAPEVLRASMLKSLNLNLLIPQLLIDLIHRSPHPFPSGASTTYGSSADATSPHRPTLILFPHFSFPIYFLTSAAFPWPSSSSRALLPITARDLLPAGLPSRFRIFDSLCPLRHRLDSSPPLNMSLSLPRSLLPDGMRQGIKRALKNSNSKSTLLPRNDRL